MGAGAPAVRDPGRLSVGLDGAPSDLRRLLLHSGDGTYALVLWRDVSLWDVPGRRDLEPGPATFEVVMGQRVELARRFDPVPVGRREPALAAAKAGPRRSRRGAGGPEANATDSPQVDSTSARIFSWKTGRAKPSACARMAAGSKAVKSSRSAVASAPTSSGGTSTPVSPGTTVSRRPPRSTPTTGRPAACASTAAMPNSSTLGTTSAWAPA